MSLVPKLHFDWILQVYLPALGSGIIHSPRYSSALSLSPLLLFFKLTVWNFLSFSCLYNKVKNKVSPESSTQSRTNFLFSNDAWNNKTAAWNLLVLHWQQRKQTFKKEYYFKLKELLKTILENASYIVTFVGSLLHIFCVMPVFESI